MAASVEGTSHLQDNIPCQDAHQIAFFQDKNGEEVIVLVASDGAGSAPFSHIGSKMVCQYFIKTVEEALQNGKVLADLEKKHIEAMVRDVRQNLRLYAELNQAHADDYACTLLLAIADSKRGIFAQIGDGAIVFAREKHPNLFYLPIQPNHGDYVNQTYFATDETAESSLRIEIILDAIDELAVLTDGLEPLAIKLQDAEAFDPFFMSFFPTLRQFPEQNPQLSTDLATFLQSPRVNERTNDDKTLVLATKRI